MPNPVESSRAFLGSADGHQLCSWLLRGFKDEDFDPVVIVQDQEYWTVRDQLKGYFDAADGTVQEKLKRAVSRALLEWRLRGHGLAVLRELTYLAGDYRATEAVPILRALVAAGKIPDVHSGEGGETLAAVVTVLGGFAGDQEAARFLKRLFFDPATPERLAAVILNSLCEYVPTEYANYLPGFMRILDTGRARFQTDLVFRHFVRVVGFDCIAEGLDKLETPVRSAFIQHIDPIFAEARARLDPATEQVIVRHIQADLRERTAGLSGSVHGGDFVAAQIPRQTAKGLLHLLQEYVTLPQDIVNFVRPPASSGAAA